MKNFIILNAIDWKCESSDSASRKLVINDTHPVYIDIDRIIAIQNKPLTDEEIKQYYVRVICDGEETHFDVKETLEDIRLKLESSRMINFIS